MACDNHNVYNGNCTKKKRTYNKIQAQSEDSYKRNTHNYERETTHKQPTFISYLSCTLRLRLFPKYYEEDGRKHPLQKTRPKARWECRHNHNNNNDKKKTTRKNVLKIFRNNRKKRCSKIWDFFFNAMSNKQTLTLKEASQIF